HDIGHPVARRYQPPGRRRAGADPDGRRRDRGAVRRAGGTEDPRRAIAALAWAPGPRRWNPLCDRTRDPARRPLHHPGNRSDGMRARHYLAILAVLVLGMAFALPRAQDERLIVSDSTYRDYVTPHHCVA